MAKKRRNRKVIPFQHERTLTYNKAKPNRQARRETQRRITPPGMTYGEYMEYLKDKRQQLEEKKKNIQE